MKKYTEEQIAELKKAHESSEAELKEMLGCTKIDRQFTKRVQAVYCRAKGMSANQVMIVSGYSRVGLSHICAVYREKGLKALQSHYVGSNFRKLSIKEETRIMEELANECMAGEYVRASSIEEAFCKKAGVVYGKNSFYQVLERHKWKKKMPRGQNPNKASAEEIDSSKKLTLYWSN